MARAKCAGRGCEHAASSHDDTGMCRRCSSCRGWALSRPHWWRDLVTETYWHWREGWEVQFDLEANQTYYRGIIADQRRLERRGGRREVCDYVDANPPPTFASVLTGLAS